MPDEIRGIASFRDAASPPHDEFGCPLELEQYRVAHPLLRERGDSKKGCLVIKPRGLKVIFAEGDGWQHLSVSRIGSDKVPTYEQLDRLRREFWAPRCCVVQLHVPASDHLNYHPGCLHLWRPVGGGIPRPHHLMV